MPWFWPRTASNTKWWCRWSDRLVEGQDSRKKTQVSVRSLHQSNVIWQHPKNSWHWKIGMRIRETVCLSFIIGRPDKVLYIVFTTDLKWLLSSCISEKCTPIIQKSAKCWYNPIYIYSDIYESTWWSRTVACPWCDETLRWRVRDVGLFEYSVHQCSMDHVFPIRMVITDGILHFQTVSQAQN